MITRISVCTSSHFIFFPYFIAAFHYFTDFFFFYRLISQLIYFLFLSVSYVHVFIKFLFRKNNFLAYYICLFTWLDNSKLWRPLLPLILLFSLDGFILTTCLIITLRFSSSGTEKKFHSFVRKMQCGIGYPSLCLKILTKKINSDIK